ncbi:MAG: transcriptional regulator [Alteromonadaceae bacterium]|nr:MAG: transcriptional regulator [Alteromonadaceae bacterium]
MNSSDLNLIRAFWAVSQCGSFSEAARSLGSTQPTLTRQIQCLERQSGLHLFERSNKGLKITEAGERLVESAGEVMKQVDGFHRSITGQEDTIEGSIRITCSELFGLYSMPDALCAMQQSYPELKVELDINDNIASLSRRDADIAIRSPKPTQTDVVSRYLCDCSLGVYGTKALLERYDYPDNLPDIIKCPLIGFDKNKVAKEELKAMDLGIGREQFSMLTDSMLQQLALARAGVGLCMTFRYVAQRFPELIRVGEGLAMPEAEFWLVCHADIQYSKKIRAVMRFLGDWFTTGNRFPGN